jgi:hypothetical protein
MYEFSLSLVMCQVEAQSALIRQLQHLGGSFGTVISPSKAGKSLFVVPD